MKMTQQTGVRMMMKEMTDFIEEEKGKRLPYLLYWYRRPARLCIIEEKTLQIFLTNIPLHVAARGVSYGPATFPVF